MLEVIYNDCYSQLSVVNDLHNETLSVIDDDYFVYGKVSYKGFAPTIKQVSEMFENALKKHLCIGAKKHDTTTTKSMLSFKKWLGGLE